MAENQENTYTPRVRTMADAVAEVKREDPESALTIGALKLAVATGKIPRVTVGNKKLVEMNAVYAYLHGEFVVDPDDTPPGFLHNRIRKIS